MADKVISLPYYTSGASGIYAKILEVDTGYFMDQDENFKAAPTDPKILFSENPNLSAVYTRTFTGIWPNGQFEIFGYDGSNLLFSIASLFLYNNEEISQSKIFEAISLIQDIEGGNWQLTGNQWIYFSPTGVEMMRFNLFDKNNAPSMENVYKRIRV